MIEGLEVFQLWYRLGVACGGQRVEGHRYFLGLFWNVPTNLAFFRILTMSLRSMIVFRKPSRSLFHRCSLASQDSRSSLCCLWFSSTVSSFSVRWCFGGSSPPMPWPFSLHACWRRESGRRGQGWSSWVPSGSSHQENEKCRMLSSAGIPCEVYFTKSRS